MWIPDVHPTEDPDPLGCIAFMNDSCHPHEHVRSELNMQMYTYFRATGAWAQDEADERAAAQSFTCQLSMRCSHRSTGLDEYCCCGGGPTCKLACGIEKVSAACQPATLAAVHKAAAPAPAALWLILQDPDATVFTSSRKGPLSSMPTFVVEVAVQQSRASVLQDIAHWMQASPA